MTISSIGSVGSTFSVSSTAHKAATASTAKSNPNGDVATISEAAKELAAKLNGTSSQEEAAESAAAQLKEQAAGLS